MNDSPSAGAPSPGAPSPGAPDLVLDCMGWLCPRPIIELGRRISDVPPGGTIEVLADDPAAATDIPAWCRMSGQEFLGGRGDWGYLVRRLPDSQHML